MSLTSKRSSMDCEMLMITFETYPPLEPFSLPLPNLHYRLIIVKRTAPSVPSVRNSVIRTVYTCIRRLRVQSPVETSFYFSLFICLWPESSFTPVLSIHSYDSVVFIFVLSLCSIWLWSVLTKLLYLVVVADQLYSWNFRALVAVQSYCSSYSLTLNCRWCVSYSRSI